jgi:xylulokinase
MKALGDQHSLQDVKALGIAGQMHGATLLDAQQRVLRPAILWNDGRCAQECTLLEARVPQSRVITGNLMMPGFTAPKLLWFSGMSRRYSVKSTKYYYRKITCVCV